MNSKEKIFEQVFNENRGKIHRLCYAYLIDKTEVEDLFQEVMINVWNSLDKFRGEAKISTWIYRIAVNTAFLFNKKTKKSKDLFIRNRTEPDTGKVESTDSSNDENTILINNLHQCIKSLEKQDRIIISLVLEGLKYNEIADITGLTTNHIGVKINRIKPILSTLMKEVQNG